MHDVANHLAAFRCDIVLQEERDAPVDVQIGPQLYENAPQELRSRMWIALLDNNTLAHSVECSAVRSPHFSKICT